MNKASVATEADDVGQAPDRGRDTAAGVGTASGSTRQAALRYLLGMGCTLVPFLLLLPYPYLLHVLTYTYLFAGAASAWNIIGGFGGQLSLGHGVFFAAGAYLSGILFMDHGISPWLTLPLAALLAAALSIIFWPTFRLKGPFFAIATMAFNEIAMAFANYFDDITGGPRGILIPFRAGFSNMIFMERWKYTLIVFGYVALVVAIALIIRRSRLGYYLRAVREAEDGARAVGINVAVTKAQGMAVSAGLTAVGGCLFAFYVRSIDPLTLFTLPEIGVKFALVALIGGLGTLAGPVVGAFLVIPLESVLRAELGGLWSGAHLVVLGLVLVLAALFMKQGIVGAGLKLWQRFGRRGS